MAHRGRAGGSRIMSIMRTRGVPTIEKKRRSEDSVESRSPSDGIRGVVKTPDAACSSKDLETGL
jgi:hypothetical protein